MSLLMRLNTIAPATQPTVDTTAYATGDLIAKSGAPMAFTIGGVSGTTLIGLTLTDADKQSAAIDVVFFSSNLSNTTLTDNAAFAPAAADLVTYLGHVNVVSGSWAAFNANSAATVKDINLPLVPAVTGGIVYAVLVSRGTPTYTNAANLKIWLNVARA